MLTTTSLPRAHQNLVIDELKAEIKRYKQGTQSKIEALKIMHESGGVQSEWGIQEAEAGVEAKEKELSSLRGLLKEVLKSKELPYYYI